MSLSPVLLLALLQEPGRSNRGAIVAVVVAILAAVVGGSVAAKKGKKP